MSSDSWRKPNNARNCFWVPNEIYRIGLAAGEIAVYGYLLSVEDWETYQCWPSYRTIGRAVRMSKNTVKKYVTSLEEKRLISTGPTSVTMQTGLKRNGNLLYTILPIQESVDYFHQRQMAQLELDAERWEAQQKLQPVAPQEPLCAALADTAGASPQGLCERD